MAIITESFNADGVQLTFTVGNDILSGSHCRVHYYYDDGLGGGPADHEVADGAWDLIGKSTLVFLEAPTNGYVVKITTSSDGTGLSESPSSLAAIEASLDDILVISGVSSELSTVAGISADVTTVAGVAANVTTVAGISTDIPTVSASSANVDLVAQDLQGSWALEGDLGLITDAVTGGTGTSGITAVGQNIDDVSDVATTVVPNIAEILLADENAATATTKASEASSSASAAASSASAASTSETNAAASAAAAALVYDTFDDLYLGAKASAPTLDNDGDTLTAGDLYFDTTLTALHVYNGASWDVTYNTAGNTLLIANNLSDLDNIVTARSNLGLGNVTNVSTIATVTESSTSNITSGAVFTALQTIDAGSIV